MAWVPSSSDGAQTQQALAIVLPTIDVAQSIPLRAFFEDVLRPQRWFGATTKTISHYRGSINAFEAFLDRPPVIADLTDATIFESMRAVVRRGCSVATANQQQKHLRALWNEAADRDLLHSRPKVQKFPKALWQPNQVVQLLFAARHLRGFVGDDVPASDLARALILTVIDSQLVIRKVLSLRGYDVDLSEGSLRRADHRPDKESKTLALHAATVNALAVVLDRQCRRPSDRVFDFAPTLSEDTGYQRAKAFMLELIKRANLLDNLAGRLDVFDRMRTTGVVFSVADISFLESECLRRAAATRPHENRLLPAIRSPEIAGETEAVVASVTITTELPDSDRLFILKALPGAKTLARFYRDDYSLRRHTIAAAATKVDFRGTIEAVNAFAGHEITIGELSDDLIDDFMRSFVARGCMPETANKHRGNLVALWNHAYKRKLRNDRPRVDKLRATKRKPTAWTIDEMRSLFEHLAQLKGEVHGIDARLWWTSLIVVLYCTGLRIRAAMMIRLCDVHLSRRAIFVPAEHQKQNANQWFTLSVEAAALVKASIDQQPNRATLFPPLGKLSATWNPVSNKLRRQYRKHLVAVGLPHGPHDLFHKIRRTTATTVTDFVGESWATWLLGHSSSQVTRDHYIDPTAMTNARTVADRIPTLSDNVLRSSAAYSATGPVRLPR